MGEKKDLKKRRDHNFCSVLDPAEEELEGSLQIGAEGHWALAVLF